MHEFSAFDGFLDITECLAEMIKHVANEPSVGLFYVQQHAQNAGPNVIRLRNNVVTKSHEITLHAEDSEDSITMVRSIKECGFSIADEMIRDIKKSLLTMSTKQPRRGLIHDSRSGLRMESTSSWGPSSWGHPAAYGKQDAEKSSYLSTVFKSAKQKASNFKWPQLDSREVVQAKDEKLLYYPKQPFLVASVVNTGSSLPDVETDELPLSSRITDEPQEEQIDTSSPAHGSIPALENYDEFKADKEAKLEEWLDDNGDMDNRGGGSDLGAI